MKKGWSLVCIVACAWLYLILPAGAEKVADIYTADGLVMDIDVSTRLDIQEDGPDARLSYARLNLSFVPMKTTTQDIVSLEPFPQGHAQVGERSIVFHFDDFVDTPVGYRARVASDNRFPDVSDKITFPLEPQSELEAYTKATELIDADDRTVMEKANELAEGEDDLVLLLSKIGTWVRGEVDYSLSTYTASATRSASWVLENRKGVCDEITGLFVAMCRSLGIPARFVSGQAYTNYNDINDWGPHAWAEVHVPGQGWVPYDITYGQFGFIDASHIALKETIEADSSSFTYAWKGYDVGLEVDDLSMETSIVSRKGPVDPLVTLDLQPVKNPVGYGSYNLIKGTIENKHDHYVMVTLNIARTSHLAIDAGPQEVITLRPSETRERYWLVEVANDLDAGYVYTLPVYMETLYNASDKAVFTARQSAPHYTREELESYVERMDTSSGSEAMESLTLNCSQAREWLYENTTQEFTCAARNRGNVFLSGTRICMSVHNLSECEKRDIGIGRSEEITFQATLEGEGEVDVFFSAESGGTKASDHLKVEVRDLPRVKVSSLKAPSEVTFNEEFIVEAHLKKESFETPQNLTIRFSDQGRVLKTLKADTMTQDHTYRLRMKGDQLAGRESTITFRLRYQDAHGRPYEETRTTTVTLTDVTFTQRLILWMNAAQSWLGNLFSPDI